MTSRLRLSSWTRVVRGGGSFRQFLLVALAMVFAVMGGAKLATWNATLGLADCWPATTAWRAVLTIAGVIEIAIGVAFVLVRAPHRLLRWVLRLLVAYALVLIAGEWTVGGFSGKCGCLGPGIALGFAEHLALTGVLIAFTWWCERLFWASASGLSHAPSMQQ